jgi:hypothetical protein
MRAPLALAALAVAATAAPIVPPSDPSRRCNPLTSSSISCFLPYPDNFFLSTTWDPAAAPRLTLFNESLPTDTAGLFIDPDAGGYNALQGFSPLGPVLSHLPGISLEASALPRLWSIPASTLPATSGSVLLHAATLTPIPHWVELDHSGDDGGQLYERALMLWPAHRLLDGERYIVAFRNATDDAGIRVAPSDGFAALLSGRATNNAALEASRPRFAAIFAALESAGWARGDLTLAWDFTTNSRADLTSKMLHMREDAFARIAAKGGVQYKITSVQEAPAANTSRRIHGSFSVPCYLPYNALPALDSLLELDPATGLPVFQNFVDFDFEVVIPLSVAAGGAPAKVLQYGHGLFGDHGEVEVNYLASFAQAHGYILAATDWIGLSEYDEITVIEMMAGSSRRKQGAEGGRKNIAASGCAPAPSLQTPFCTSHTPPLPPPPPSTHGCDHDARRRRRVRGGTCSGPARAPPPKTPRPRAPPAAPAHHPPWAPFLPPRSTQARAALRTFA